MSNILAGKLPYDRSKTRKAVFAASTVSLLMLTLCVVGNCTSTLVTTSISTNLSSSSDDTWAVGTWEGGRGDAGATYRITLTLNADGTYRKTLATNIGAGGTHSGTWSLKGTTVYLSGDGNWPASSHDLSTFRKVN